MLRRSFLQTSAAGAAAGSLASTSRAAKRLSSGAVRVAILGVRGRGRSLTKQFSQSEDAVVTTICDVDLNICEPVAEIAEQTKGHRPKVVQDLRRVMDDKNIDAVAVVLPDHWHGLATIWACQAGKDVYLEKPVAHNIHEGRLILEAARKYNRIVQVGHHNRSGATTRAAMEFLHNGGIGKIWMARGLCYKYRRSIGRAADGPTPAGVDYALWLGPAAKRPFNALRFHYNWRWFWEYGSTDMGAQGIHQLDIARWGLQKDEMPKTVHGSGGKFLYDDDQETPNCQMTQYEYADGTQLVFEVRGLMTNDERGARIGNVFYGEKGYLVMGLAGREGWQAYRGPEGELGTGLEHQGPDANVQNFVDAVQARDPKILNCEIANGNVSTELIHLANISYRVGRKLRFDAATATFPGDDEANALVRRASYRKPFVLPEKV